MTEKILIVAGLPDFLPEGNFDMTIGVDRGSLYLAEQGCALDLAVGDFDSVSADEFSRISVRADKMIKLPAEKDKTDLEVAFDWVIDHAPEAEVLVAGALGGRLDHALTNVYLATRPEYQLLAPKLTMVDQLNLVRYLMPGQHVLHRIPGYKYIGFVQVDSKDTLSIAGAKYPLKAEENFSQIYASNEFVSETMTVALDCGMVMVIYSGDAGGKNGR